MAKHNRTFKSEDDFSDLVGDDQETAHPDPDSIEPTGDWRPIDTAPIGGLPCFISNEAEGEGVLAFYKRTRAFRGKKWEEIGKWVDNLTGVDIAFKPVFWRERFKAVVSDAV